MKKVSIVIPVYNVDPKRFKRTLRSLVSQSFKDFEICISDGGEKKVKNIVDDFAKQLDIKYISSETDLGISDNTNAALKLVSGKYVGFLDHDDLLLPNSIKESVAKLDNGFDVVYSDEDIVDENGRILNKLFKPDFSPDLLYAQNYICHFLVVKKEVLDKVGKFDASFDGAQDYDFILRVTEVTQKIGHIPKILYHWLSTSESTSTNSSAKPYAQTAGLKALDAHLKRVYGKQAEAIETENLFVYQPRYHNLKKQKIDIIIPMRDKWILTEGCVSSIIEKTKYRNYQITIIDNGSQDDLTKKWLRNVQKLDKRIRVLEADFEFNWSKLQNFGINNSDADAFVFLNNDTVVTDGDWLEILGEQALRDGIGVVGPLLLYDDGTIQHAGVVVGLGGYADHVYKNSPAIHSGVNYISPMVQRDVLAVTGACMAISRKTLDKIGLFDEKFIICGSDVEICIRAHEMGLFNVYTPNTQLIHLESKSRSPKIPAVDFRLSRLAYQKYWDNGDPFYNRNLNYNSLIPFENPKSIINKKEVQLKKRLKKSRAVRAAYSRTRNVLRQNRLIVKAYRKARAVKRLINASDEEDDDLAPNKDFRVIEINKIKPVKIEPVSNKIRINLLVPSLNQEHIFGGIATALKFFEQFDEKYFDKRLVVTNMPLKKMSIPGKYSKYVLCRNGAISHEPLQVVDLSFNPVEPELTVSKQDVFIATAWWTAYNIAPIIEWQKDIYSLKKTKPLIYLIQDFEPGFYKWSSRYVLAEGTYTLDIPTIAVFNSKELKDYFKERGFKFEKEFFFDPVLNDKLKYHLLNDKEIPRKKQIIVYGRPKTLRNAFEIVVSSLREAFKDRNDIKEWKLLSMGEDHADVEIKDGVRLVSVGKLTLDGYAKTMEESYLGISLMVSPHPSYPPLELSSFGVKTITNNYANKDLSKFNCNIISVSRCDPTLIAKEITKYIDRFDKLSKTAKKSLNKKYIDTPEQFGPIVDSITKIL